MSKISLKPNASGTGVFSLKAPNSNTDRTLNLPDEAGSVLTDVSDIESQVKTATNATGSAPVYACRAWVNFDGTGTVSIRGSGNVSSITDNGTGNYEANFSNSFLDSNYSVLAVVGQSNIHRALAFRLATNRAAVRVFQGAPGSVTADDDTDISFALFR